MQALIGFKTIPRIRCVLLARVVPETHVPRGFMVFPAGFTPGDQELEEEEELAFLMEVCVPHRLHILHICICIHLQYIQSCGGGDQEAEELCSSWRCVCVCVRARVRVTEGIGVQAVGLGLE